MTHCCDVSSYKLSHGVAAADLPKIVPQRNLGIRDANYKLVQNFTKGFDATTKACVDSETEEFYAINQDLPVPKLDREGDDLLAANGVDGLTKNQQKSNVLCQADGNRDGVVDKKDLEEWEKFSTMNGGGSSWYDFTGPENLGPDGHTDTYDMTFIQKYIGKPCRPVSK